MLPTDACLFPSCASALASGRKPCRVVVDTACPSCCGGDASLYERAAGSRPGPVGLPPTQAREWGEEHAGSEVPFHPPDEVVTVCTTTTTTTHSAPCCHLAAVGADRRAAAGDASAASAASAANDLAVAKAAGDLAAAKSGATAGQLVQPTGLCYPVTLQVYDLSYLSRLARVPFFHLGVEVHGKEFSFGKSGLICCKPGANKCHVHREACAVGFTMVAKDQVVLLWKSLSPGWRGSTYSPFTNNCQHFAAKFCEALGVAGGAACIPGRYLKLPAPTSPVAQASDRLFGMYSSMPACSQSIGEMPASDWSNSVPDCGSVFTQGAPASGNASETRLFVEV